MADPQPHTDPQSPDEMTFLPFDDGADEGTMPTRRVDPVPPDRFLYIGQGLTADEFTNYVQSYDFGSIPPDFIVLHHTAIPGATYARYQETQAWDDDEVGFTPDQIKQQRLGKLNNIKEHYRVKLLWDRGPHLFVDDQFIWLFTPMRDVGIHAAQGNSNNQGGRLHYSLGIEVIGYYEQVAWPAPVAALVGHAVAVLKRRLGTFELRYKVNQGGISSHRDYNKPQCPGSAISEDFYIGVLNEGWQRLINPVQPRIAERITADSPILGPASGQLDQAIAYIKAQLPADSEYKNDVETIMGYYWQYAPAVGVDPFMAAAQCVLETDALRSQWAGRPRRNPAGLGVRQEGGLLFPSWEEAVQAHIGQLLAFALRDDQANDAQRQMMQRNPRHNRIAGDLRGSAPTLRGLNNRWTADPIYADKLATRAAAMRG